jgi:citrate lyase subunit beta/citryl-CoA lyase
MVDFVIKIDYISQPNQYVWMETPTILRSLLSVPALNPRFFDKATVSPADAIVFDLEDSIAPARKLEARRWLADALPRFPRDRRPIFVRPNELASGLLEGDLDAVVRPGLDGVYLPKVHGPEVVERVDHYLTLIEAVREMAPGSTRLIVWVESSTGVGNVERICGSSARLLAVAFGAEDYVTSLGVMRTRTGAEVSYARARIANAALGAGLVAIDCPEPDYRDLAHFEREIGLVRALGYSGKYCIHPEQVLLANRLFRPDPEQVRWARRVVAAYAEGESRGLGAVGLDGAMIDRPIYGRALRVLGVHDVIELRERQLTTG